MVDCPICGKSVREAKINSHIDSGCDDHVEGSSPKSSNPQVAAFFRTPSSKKAPPPTTATPTATSGPERRVDASISVTNNTKSVANEFKPTNPSTPGQKRSSTVRDLDEPLQPTIQPEHHHDGDLLPPAKRHKASTALQRAAPLAERMRPHTLDHIYGQDLVGPTGVLRGLIEADRVPSMILWGSAGTGKTTIARVIASLSGSRFVEINSTSSGVAECKKLFAEAKSELSLTGRKTIIFCDEIHRFSKTQQDVFLGPVESGQVTLIGATTENPSFKVQDALLSRCRTFTLQQLNKEDILTILERALDIEGATYNPDLSLIDYSFLEYIAAFAEGDARTALNLLELAMTLSNRPSATKETIKAALTKTLVYDRAGDQHYDAISALHKSIRGSAPSASLFYLSRMLSSGESPLYISRRLIVIASEDIGLADNTILPLAIATHTAVQTVGMPECRINLAHAVVALALAPKSTRVYRSLCNVEKRIKSEPGTGGCKVPVHLRNAPTRLMKELGVGKGYKYPPMYRGGRCRQEYMPEELIGVDFLEEDDLGNEVDPDLEEEELEELVEEEEEEEHDYGVAF